MRRYNWAKKRGKTMRHKGSRTHLRRWYNYAPWAAATDIQNWFRFFIIAKKHQFSDKKMLFKQLTVSQPTSLYDWLATLIRAYQVYCQRQKNLSLTTVCAQVLIEQGVQSKSLKPFGATIPDIVSRQQKINAAQVALFNLCFTTATRAVAHSCAHYARKCITEVITRLDPHFTTRFLTTLLHDPYIPNKIRYEAEYIQQEQNQPELKQWREFSSRILYDHMSHRHPNERTYFQIKILTYLSEMSDFASKQRCLEFLSQDYKVPMRVRDSAKALCEEIFEPPSTPTPSLSF